MSTLREQHATVAAELKDQWGRKNLYEIPRLEKIVVNVGMGRAKEENAYKDLVVDSLTQITGQKPIITKARLSIAGFKLREGQEIGAKVTLRGQRMENFYSRLVNVVLPRVRDFRGLSPKAFDRNGNYTLGITEHTVFPEISADDVTRTHPLQITIVTTAKTDAEAEVVLRKLGLPLTGDAPEVAKLEKA